MILLVGNGPENISEIIRYLYTRKVPYQNGVCHAEFAFTKYPGFILSRRIGAGHEAHAINSSIVRHAAENGKRWQASALGYTQPP